MNETVSVIIPIYNIEKYLPECLDSIINQTYKNLEIICINDCTPDNSMQIVEGFATKDNRIKIIDKNKNAGLSAARNSGLDAVTGEYIYFLDGDDWIDLDYIEKMVNAIQKTDADIVVNKNILTEFSDSKKIFYEHPPEKDIQINSYINIYAQIHKTFWVVWNKIYKTSFLKNNNLKFPVGYIMEDLYFHYITFAAAQKIFYTEGSTYHYRDRSDSVSKTQDDVGANCIKIFGLIYDYFAQNDLLDKKMKIYSTFGWFNIKNEQIYDEYKKYFDKAINYLNANKDVYNELDLYFANNIANTVDYQDYVSKYPRSAVLSYVRRKK